MPKGDEQHEREARRRFKNEAVESLRRHGEDAAVARKVADDAALDLKTRKEYRRKRVSSIKQQRVD